MIDSKAIMIGLTAFFVLYLSQQGCHADTKLAADIQNTQYSITSLQTQFSSTQEEVSILSAQINDLTWVVNKLQKDAEPNTSDRLYKITCYNLPEGWVVARHMGPDGKGRAISIRECMDWACNIRQLDGICAVGESTPWYNHIRDENPPVLHVEGRGNYLAVDRIGSGSDIDIWDPHCHEKSQYPGEQVNYYRFWVRVTEVK